MKRLNNTDPVRLDAYFKKWRYSATDRKANEMSLGNFGMTATISCVSEIAFSLRMRVKGERRRKVVGRFRYDANGTVTYGTNHAITDAMELRKQWMDEAEGKIVVNPKDIPTFAQLLERYEDALTHGTDPLLSGRVLPKSWHKQLGQTHAVYAPFIAAEGGKDVRVNFITRDAIHECHTKYLVKRQQETGKRPYKSIRLIFNAVRPVLVWARDKQWMHPQTLMGLRANVPKEETRKRVLLPGEWQKAAKALDTLHADPDVGLAMRFMLATACRRAMATQMKWGQLQTVDTREYGRESLTLWCVPAENMKMGLLAIFPIVGEAARIIEAIRSRPGASCKAHEHVFFETARNAWNNTADHWQKLIFEKSGTKEWHRHDLRRTTASLLEVFGADTETVKKLLAHRARADKGATGGYLSIGKNTEALVKLAGQLERVHKLYADIEAGKVSKDLRKLYTEIHGADDLKRCLAELKVDLGLIEIEEDTGHRAPVTPIRRSK
jgi:integrase